MGATAFAIDGSIPALPSTAQFFNAPMDVVQLTVGLYILGYGLGQIPMGFCADAFGRRPTALVGMSLFVAAGIIASFSTSVDMLLVSRFLQGVFGACGAVVSRAVARDITQGPQATRLFSLLTSTLGIVMLVAPIAGAIMLAQAGWRGPFLLSAAFGFIGVALTWVYVVETRPASQPTAMMQRLRQGGASFFKSRQSLIGTILVGLSFTGLIIFVTISSKVFVVGFKMSELTYAFVFATVSVGYFLGGVISRQLVVHRSAIEMSRYVSFGFGICACALIAILALQSRNFPILLMVFVLYFACIGSMLSLGTAVVLEPLGQTAGMASALLGTAQLLTGSLASLAVSFIPMDAYKLLLICLALVAVTTLLVSQVLQSSAKVRV